MELAGVPVRLQELVLAEEFELVQGAHFETVGALIQLGLGQLGLESVLEVLLA
jgi:hypothetical protein